MKNGRFLHRLTGLFCLAILLMGYSACGYTRLGSDRVLLMNNDTNVWNTVTYQGYNDTDPSKDTYWVHSTEAGYGRATYLKLGLTHTLYRNDGTVLWHLRASRAGSCTVSSTGRSYLPWSKTSESIISEGSYDFTDVIGVGSVIFRNTTESAVFSPLYLDGVGVVLFDAVNTYVSYPGKIAVEYSTNAVEGVAFQDATYEQCLWKTAAADVYERKKVGRGTALVLRDVGVDAIVLDSPKEASEHFFRVRADLYNALGRYRGPIRFRIVRKEKNE